VRKKRAKKQQPVQAVPRQARLQTAIREFRVNCWIATRVQWHLLKNLAAL
jgi:hypothetical protein